MFTPAVDLKSEVFWENSQTIIEINGVDVLNYELIYQVKSRLLYLQVAKVKKNLLLEKLEY